MGKVGAAKVAAAAESRIMSGPLVAAAAELGAAEWRRWNTAAAKAWVAIAARVAAATLCSTASAAHLLGAGSFTKKVGCGSLAVLVDQEFALLLGDSCWDFVKTFGGGTCPAAEFAMVTRREKVVGPAAYLTKTRFREDGREHGITITYSRVGVGEAASSDADVDLPRLRFRLRLRSLLRRGKKRTQEKKKEREKCIRASDKAIHAKEILKLRERLYAIYARHTHQPVHRIERFMERDTYMSPAEAKKCGLIDAVIQNCPITTDASGGGGGCGDGKRETEEDAAGRGGGGGGGKREIEEL
uniref:Uncharacterized protein n=1 Tax=Ananas comosus var. bracteatus TaxID=296719 RepID=A0A6V7PWK3_ANACO|nr:unnamed protein product [Ananas comosus var. bracteatus]